MCLPHTSAFPRTFSRLCLLILLMNEVLLLIRRINVFGVTMVSLFSLYLRVCVHFREYGSLRESGMGLPRLVFVWEAIVKSSDRLVFQTEKFGMFPPVVIIVLYLVGSRYC